MYDPTPEQEQLISEINSKFERWRRHRQPNEQQWYLNAAFLRGQQYVTWNVAEGKLTTPAAPAHRVRLVVNRIQPKMRARRAKYLKNRPVPVVVPASTDHKAQLDARLTSKALEFQWDRLQLERKYRESLLWAEQASRGFWWFYWDPALLGRVRVPSPLPGMPPQVQEAALGDICVEVGSPFELLVADPGAHSLALQPEIMRVKLRPLEEVKARYPDFAEFIQPGGADLSSFQYEQKIASLNSSGTMGGNGFLEDRKGTAKVEGNDLVLMKEHFIRPNAAHPKGAYRLMAGEVLLVVRDELPYGFWDMSNPYPVVEFVDIETVGQYWGTTQIEQLIPIQREYNLVRSKVAEQLRMMAFPKLLAAKQHNIPQGAWTSEAGEFVEYLAMPGVPPPTPWHPPNIASDAWQAIELMKQEFDEVTQIYPAAEGKVAGATSGFQTNLLQEATDVVHGPDIRAHELTIEEAAYKMRRMMKMGYNTPRLLSLVGAHYAPEVVEFSEQEIDEHAKIRVQVGSMLPDLKAARIQAGMELFKSGVMGNPQDPAVRRRVLSLIDVGSLEDTIDIARIDEQQAKLENAKFEETGAIQDPEFFEDHTTHFETHSIKLKSPEAQMWPPQKRLGLIAHLIKHLAYQNPQAAQTVAVQYGLLPPLPPQPAAQPGLPPGAPPPPAPPGSGPAPQPPAPPPQPSVRT